MGRQHKSRSPLTGPHPLARSVRPDKASSALQILRDAFAAQTHIETPRLPGHDLSRAIAESSVPSTLIVPRRGHHLPYHVLGTGKHQPWELLPLRAAAFKQYPNIFSEACMFFSSLQNAVRTNRPYWMLKCNKASLDLAKLMRNLGVLASFEVVQNISHCKAQDFIWPAGEEPRQYSDLAMHPHLRVKLGVRWDAYKPIWQPPSMSVLREPLHSTDGLPFAVRHLSRPSVPALMTPQDVKKVAYSLPAGIVIMYHDQLGLTVDAVTEQYNVSALALTHVALPWVQVAQIKAALRDKVAAERGLPLPETTPLTDWRLSDWLATTLQRREAQLAQDRNHINKQKQLLTNHAAALNKQDEDKAQRSLVAGHSLHNELVAMTLLDKLRDAAVLAANLPGTSSAHEDDSGAPPAGSSGQGQQQAGSAAGVQQGGRQAAGGQSQGRTGAAGARSGPGSAQQRQAGGGTQGGGTQRGGGGLFGYTQASVAKPAAPGMGTAAGSAGSRARGGLPITGSYGPGLPVVGPSQSRHRGQQQQATGKPGQADGRSTVSSPQQPGAAPGLNPNETGRQQ